MFECPNLDPFERAVANVYAEYAKNGTEAWVVTAEMTRRTGIGSRSTITKVTGRLVAKGWLVRIRPGTPHRAAVYRIAIPDDCMDDVHKSALCPSEAHKEPSSLVSTRGAQEEKPLVSTRGANLVSISGANLVSTRGAQSVHDQFSNQSGRAGSVVEFLCEHYGVPEPTGLDIWKRIQDAAPGPIRSPLKYARRAVEDNPEKWHQPPRPALPSVADLAADETHKVTDSSGFRAWRKATPEAQAAAEAQARAELGDEQWFSRACELIGAMP